MSGTTQHVRAEWSIMQISWLWRSDLTDKEENGNQNESKSVSGYSDPHGCDGGCRLRIKERLYA